MSTASTIVGARAGFEAINARIEALASAFDGETADEWLRLGVDPRSPEVFSWTREAVVR